MKEHVISVIVPVYRIEAYIERCVQSIQTQTYSSLEIILVDDGSPDGCGAICDQFAQGDARIKVIHKPNGGLSDARNAGIEVATGSYIAFVDGDDYIHENYIQALYDAIQNTQAQVAVCSFTLVEEARHLKDEQVCEMPVCISGYRLLQDVLTPTGYKYVVAWNKLYDSTLFSQLRFKKGVLYEDEYINYPLFWEVDRVALVPESLYYYVQRSGSIQGSRVTWDRLLTKQDIHKNRMAFYEARNARELAARSAQMYCNWIVNVCYENRDCLNAEHYVMLQREIREYSKGTVASKGELIQNILAYGNLRLVAWIKGTMKKRKGVLYE